MKEAEAVLSKEEQKEKIRQRYKGIDPNMLEVIPAKPKVKLFEDTWERNGWDPQYQHRQLNKQWLTVLFDTLI